MAKTMNKNKVLKLLELFPEIDGEIKSRRSFISDLEQYYNPIQGVGYSDTTKGKYANSDPTERLALNIPEYVRGDIQRYHVNALAQLPMGGDPLSQNTIRNMCRYRRRQRFPAHGW